MNSSAIAALLGQQWEPASDAVGLEGEEVGPFEFLHPLLEDDFILGMIF